MSYRTAMIPLLPNLAQSLAAGFEASREGCFLWATDAVVREFADGAELVDAATSQAVYQFFEQQSVAFLRILNELPPEQLPDGKYHSMLHWTLHMLSKQSSDRGFLPSRQRCHPLLSQGMRYIITGGAHILCWSQCSDITAS